MSHRPDDKETTTGFAQNVLGQARAIVEARPAVERMQNGRKAADVKGEFHAVAAMTNDIAEKLAKNELGCGGVRFRRPAIT